MNNECICGRIGEHCPSANCKGSVNRHPLKQRSMAMSLSLGKDARFYSCRACGTEYGYVDGILYDSECYAPKRIRLETKLPDAIDEVKMIGEAIALLKSKGMSVTMNGLQVTVEGVGNEEDNLVSKNEECESNGNRDTESTRYSDTNKQEGITNTTRVGNDSDIGRLSSSSNEETSTFSFDEMIKDAKESKK